jgi:hypothetical protein
MSQGDRPNRFTYVFHFRFSFYFNSQGVLLQEVLIWHSVYRPQNPF